MGKYRRRVTIRDVARDANVSIATVSRVLNKPDMVDASTKSRVRDVMGRLDFQPSGLTRGIGTKKIDTIGVLVPNIRDLYFDELYRGIEHEAIELGMKVLLAEEKSSSSVGVQGFTFLKQQQVDGIIFSSRLVTEDYDAVLHRIELPVVLVLTESSTIELPAFKTDEVRAMFDAVAYLVVRGHRRIGLIGARGGGLSAEQRFAGYCQGLSHYGIDYVENRVVDGDFRFDSGYAAMKQLLDRQTENQLTAVCAISDEMAVGAMHCLYDIGLKVPDDISVIGFDDLPLSRMVTPTLTTVAQSFFEIGSQAVQTVVEMSQHSLSDWATGIHFIPHSVVERDSVRRIEK